MLSLAAALLLSAQPSNAWLEEARALISKLKFADALERLEVARQVPGLDAPTKQSILEWMAYCQVAEGRRDDAERTFTALLELDPGAALSRDVSSPKVAEAFEAARRKHFPPDYVKLSEAAAPVGRAQLELVDPWGKVARVVLHQRRDAGEWKAQVLTGPLTFPLVVPVGGQLEWYVEALDANARVLAAVGSSASPKELRVPRVVQEAQAVSEAPSASLSGKRVAGIVALSLGVALGAVATGLQVSAWNQRLEARDRTRAPGDFAATALEAERNALTQQGWAIGLLVAGGVSLGTGVVLVW
jgi:hypothetical protein